MKPFFYSIAIAVALFGLTSGRAQSPAAQTELQQEVLALVQEIKNQQAQITDNQGKIDSKMADDTETVRVARLFAGKAGK